MERAVHKVRRLRQETGKAVTGQVKEKVPDTSFLIDRSRLPEPNLSIILRQIIDIVMTSK